MEKALKPKMGVRKATRDLAILRLRLAVNRVLLVGIENLAERRQLTDAHAQLRAAVRGCWPSVIGEFPAAEWEIAGPLLTDASRLNDEILAKLRELYPEVENGTTDEKK